jgi:hypothetical protein
MKAILFALVNVALLVLGALMLHSILAGPQHHLMLGAAGLVVVLCKRRRYVVARWLNSPDSPGEYERAANWPDLEPEARRFWASEGEPYQEGYTIGAPAGLARKAEWSQQI